MKKKLAFVLSLVMCCVMLSSCTTLTALISEQRANAVADSTSGDTVTISREEYEKYKQFDKLLELMDIVDEGYFEDYDTQSLLDGAADGRESAPSAACSTTARHMRQASARAISSIRWRICMSTPAPLTMR